jgi:hypothetical protein
MFREKFDKDAQALRKDVCDTFTRAAAAAVPPLLRKRWTTEDHLAKLQEDIDAEIEDRRLEVRFWPYMSYHHVL